MKKELLTTVMSLMVCVGVFAQNAHECENAPKSNEIVIGRVDASLYAGKAEDYKNSNDKDYDNRRHLSIEEIYDELLIKARNIYGKEYPKIALRNLRYRSSESTITHNKFSYQETTRYYECSATVVILDPIQAAQENLSKAINKALQNIREGSRLALDVIKCSNDCDKDDFKDQIVEVLLDEGYKVVAKEYLEKLYEEQQNQQSGIYNDRTTVQENNFSAVGYYINVKQTETAIKVQVINVSTGEYDANVTVNLE